MLKRIDYTHFICDGVVPRRVAVRAGGGTAPRVVQLSPAIAIAAWLSFVAFVLFLERSFGAKVHRESSRHSARPTFAFACTFNFVIGFGLYASTYLVPVFLGQVRDFTSLQIGGTVFVTGIAQILSTVLAARLPQRMSIRARRSRSA